jgi:hypothetical protein
VNLPVPVTASPALVRSSLSPIAIGGALGGAALGLVASGGVVGIVILLLLGWTGGAATAYGIGLRGSGDLRNDRIDPFAIGEPWRFFVRDAVTARNRFDDALRSARPGPLKDRLTTIRESVESGVRECWEVAKQAQTIAEARKAIDVPALRRRLGTLEARDADTQATERSIQSQLESAARLDSVLTDVTSKLEILEAQLTEAVTRAIEVSALAGHDDDLTGVGTKVEEVVDNLEALRAALAETNSRPARELPRRPDQELPPPQD